MAPQRDYFLIVVRILYGLVIGFGLLLTAITFHSFHPVVDPVTPVTFLDKISYWMGVHEKTAIVVLDLGAWNTLVYTYIFHRHISDGTFHIEEEKKTVLLPGMFSEEAIRRPLILDKLIEEIMATASSHMPGGLMRLRLRPSDCHLAECKPPILVKVSNDALALNKRVVSGVLQKLARNLEANSSFYFNPEKSLGALSSIADETAFQWFSIHLLRHTFFDWKVSASAIILDVGDKDMHITMAVPGSQTLPEQRIMSVRHMSAFGHSIKLVTIKYPGLGLFAARQHIFGLSSTPTVTSTRDGTTGIDVRSACVNPVCDAFWEWDNTTYHVRGVVNGTYELVRERNGPFAGKKINRPVAKYDYCHRVSAAYVAQKIRVSFEEPDGGKVDKVIFDSIRGGRPVFMAGHLREKCIERGLTLPDSGGNVKMRVFLESLKHACKVPNTEQPFACTDLMFLATLVDQLLGFKQGSVLHSASDVNGMTADWPLAAAFHIYQNGL